MWRSFKKAGLLPHAMALQVEGGAGEAIHFSADQMPQ